MAKPMKTFELHYPMIQFFNNFGISLFLFLYSFMFIIEHMMPLCMTVSWIYTVALAVQAIVYEKEQRLKEVMKMMGLSNAVHWVAWFITSLCVMSITVFLLVITLKVNSSTYFCYVWEVQSWHQGSCARLWIKRSGFKP